MTDPLTFTVRGTPVPQGSVRAFVRGDRAVVNSTTARLDDWRHAIATEARDAMSSAPLMEGPLTVSLWFTFARPASHYLPANSRRPVRTLRLDAPEYVTTAPDIDKLERAALDAMAGVVYANDRAVVRLHGDKRYDEWSGVEVRVVRL